MPKLLPPPFREAKRSNMLTAENIFAQKENQNCTHHNLEVEDIIHSPVALAAEKAKSA
jgi:hypothetical protein